MAPPAKWNTPQRRIQLISSVSASASTICGAVMHLCRAWRHPRFRGRILLRRFRAPSRRPAIPLRSSLRPRTRPCRRRPRPPSLNHGGNSCGAAWRPLVAQRSSKPADGKLKSMKYVYSFGEGTAEGNGSMKDELGGKGAGLAEMTNAGLPVPPGFTISTATCREYYKAGNRVPGEVDEQMRSALQVLERTHGKRLGDAADPLLVSVRSGAKFSMPGMMDTILNLGLNDKTVEGLAQRTGNPRFSYDSYRRLIQMFGNVVLDIPKAAFDKVFDGQKKKRRVKLDTELSAGDLQEVIGGYKKLVKQHTGREFPQDALEQLTMARDAVFRSWFNDRAGHYRRMNNISDDLGTAVNVQAMVFGNLGDTS